MHIKKYYEDAISTVKVFRGKTRNIQPLKELVLATPAQSRYMYYYRQSLRINFSKPELDNYSHKLLNCDNLLTLEHKETAVSFWNRLGETGPIQSILQIYQSWLSILEDPSDIKSHLNIFSGFCDKAYCKTTFRVIHAFALDLQSLLVEINKLKLLLSIAIGHAPAYGAYSRMACRESITIDTDHPRLMAKIEAKEHYNREPNLPLYALTSISSLVAFEITLFDQYNISPRYCQICQLPYFSTQSNAKFCHFPNNSYNETPCNKVAKSLVVALDDVKKVLDTNRNTYGTWTRRCRSEKPPNYIINLKRFVIGNPTTFSEKERRAKLWEDILNDLKTTYAAWSERVGKIYTDYEKGLITKAQCISLIEVPGLHERGELFWRYYKEMKEAEDYSENSYSRQTQQ